MTEEIKELLRAKPDWFATQTKRVWQPDELAYTYTVYNMYYGENRRDTGCGSCRRSIISHVRHLYSKMIAEDKQT